MSSKKTENLSLHAWEAADAFTREEFNENFAALDANAGRTWEELEAKADTASVMASVASVTAAAAAKATVLAGTYVGDNAGMRKIELGATPKAVFVLADGYRMEYGNQYYGGVATTASSSQGLSVTDGGFYVQITGNICLNLTGTRYTYVALC